MKFSLRTLALGATMLVAGAMMAQTSDVTVTQKWLTHELVAKGFENGGDVRSGSGWNGLAYISNGMSIMTFDGTEVKTLYSHKGINRGFAVDDAGNIAIAASWPTSDQNWYKWLIIKADGSKSSEITLSAPNGWTGARTDLVGRAVGDFFSEEGGVFYLTTSGVKFPIPIWIKNGNTQVELSAPSVTGFNAAQTLAYANPRYSWDEMTVDNMPDAFYYEATNSQNIQYVNENENKVATIPWPAQASYNAQNGFDVFELGGKRYAVHVFDYATEATWGSNFKIWDIDNGTAIWTSNYSVADGTDGKAATGNGCSFVARKVNETTVQLFQCYCAGKNQSTGVDYKANSFNAMYEITIPKPDYTSWYVNVPGEYNNWANNGVACNEDGIATFHNLAIGNGGFKVKVDNGSDNWHSNGLTITPGQWRAIPENRFENMTIVGAAADSHYDVEYNVLNNQIRVTEIEPTYVLRADFVDPNWSDFTLTQENGLWKSETITVENASSFGIRKMIETDQLAWINSDGDGAINETGEYSCKVDGTNFSIPAGTYTFTFDPAAMKLTVEGEVLSTLNTYTVYFDNSTANWENVNCYVWNDGSDGLVAWPGEAMTEGENDIWSYTFEAAKTPDLVIFNNAIKNGDEVVGKDQTDNLVFEDGKTYTYTPAVTTGFTVYFDNSKANWENVNCYVWNDGSDGLVAWPGAEMTKGDNNIWSYSFEAAVAPDFVIFNNAIKNGNEVVGKDQTGNLAFVDGKTYTYPETIEVNITYDNAKSGWPKVYCYFYNEGGDVGNGWPGYEMTAISVVDEGPMRAASNTWSLSTTLPSTPTKVIFNNGSTGDGNQTGDGFEYKENSTYSYDGVVSGLENISIDAEATVEYYNLQGVRVANPTHGLYIRRAGNTTTKVVL